MDYSGCKVKLGARPGFGLLADVTVADKKGKPTTDLIICYKNESEDAEVKYQIQSGQKLNAEFNAQLPGLEALSGGVSCVGDRNLMARLEFNDPSLFCMELKAGIERGEYALPYNLCFCPGLGITMGVEGKLPGSSGFVGSQLYENIAVEWKAKNVAAVYWGMEWQTRTTIRALVDCIPGPFRAGAEFSWPLKPVESTAVEFLNPTDRPRFKVGLQCDLSKVRSCCTRPRPCPARASEQLAGI